MDSLSVCVSSWDIVMSVSVSHIHVSPLFTAILFNPDNFIKKLIWYETSFFLKLAVLMQLNSTDLDFTMLQSTAPKYNWKVIYSKTKVDWVVEISQLLIFSFWVVVDEPTTHHVKNN